MQDRKFGLKIFFSFMIFFTIVLFWPQEIYATDNMENNLDEQEIIQYSAGDVLITEIEYNPPQSGADTNYEWFEVFNNTDSPINLTDWTIYDNTAFDKIPTFTLNNGEFLVIAARQSGFLTNFSHLPKNFLTIADGAIGNGLANSGDSITIKDSSGQIIDSISWPNKAPSVSDGYSIARIPFDGNWDAQKHPSPGLSSVFLESPTNITYNSMDLIWSDYDFLDFKKFEIYSLDEDGNEHLIQEITNPTITNWNVKNLEPVTDYQFFIRVINNDEFFADSNIIRASTDFGRSNSIIISEIYPYPSTNSNDEWIEIYNNGTEIVNLSHWFIDDICGGSKPYQIPKGIIILPQQFLVFYKSQTGIAFNDSSGDLARLLWPDGTTVFQTLNYGSAKKGQSFALAFDGTWQWTTTLTPGAINQITLQASEEDEKEISLISIAQAKNYPKGTQVLVEGIVIAPPNLFSERYFYIQDNSSGIQIYYYKGNFLDLELGNKLRILGEISIFSGEKRIKIASNDDITILGHSPPVQPIKIKTGEVGYFLGQLVQIKGKMIKTDGSTFYINDGSGQIKISILSKTGIKKSKMKKGDWVEIIGIVSLSRTGYRVLPRLQNDIKVKIRSTKSDSQSSNESSIEKILGTQKALASPYNLEIGKDYRVKSKASLNLGRILILSGSGLLIIFLTLEFILKKRA